MRPPEQRKNMLATGALVLIIILLAILAGLAARSGQGFAVECLTAAGNSMDQREWWTGHSERGLPICSPEPRRAAVFGSRKEAAAEVGEEIAAHRIGRMAVVVAP